MWSEAFTESNSTSFVYTGSHATTHSSQAITQSHSNSHPEPFNNVFGTLATMRWQELEWTNVLRQKECMPGYQ
jgi:hypothetical protein